MKDVYEADYLSLVNLKVCPGVDIIICKISNICLKSNNINVRKVWNDLFLNEKIISVEKLNTKSSPILSSN